MKSILIYSLAVLGAAQARAADCTTAWAYQTFKACGNGKAITRPAEAGECKKGQANCIPTKFAVCEDPSHGFDFSRTTGAKIRLDYSWHRAGGESHNLQQRKEICKAAVDQWMHDRGRAQGEVAIVVENGLDSMNKEEKKELHGFNIRTVSVNYQCPIDIYRAASIAKSSPACEPTEFVVKTGEEMSRRKECGLEKEIKLVDLQGKNGAAELADIKKLEGYAGATCVACEHIADKGDVNRLYKCLSRNLDLFVFGEKDANLRAERQEKYGKSLAKSACTVVMGFEGLNQANKLRYETTTDKANIEEIIKLSGENCSAKTDGAPKSLND